jgi:hypothetical protein
MVADIKSVVEQALAMAEHIRALGLKFEQDIGERTLEVTDTINAYVTFCGKTTDLFKTLQNSPSMPNGHPKSEKQWEDENNKLRASLTSDIDGR